MNTDINDATVRLRNRVLPEWDVQRWTDPIETLNPMWCSKQEAWTSSCKYASTQLVASTFVIPGLDPFVDAIAIGAFHQSCQVSSTTHLTVHRYFLPISRTSDPGPTDHQKSLRHQEYQPRKPHIVCPFVAIKPAKRPKGLSRTGPRSSPWPHIMIVSPRVPTATSCCPPANRQRVHLGQATQK